MRNLEPFKLLIWDPQDLSNRSRSSWRTLLAAFLALAAGCAPPPESVGDTRVQVVTTIGMIRDAVENVGGEHVSVTGLMGPGVDPHLYKAREGDVRRLFRADVIFYAGLHLEAKMAEV